MNDKRSLPARASLLILMVALAVVIAVVSTGIAPVHRAGDILEMVYRTGGKTASMIDEATRAVDQRLVANALQRHGRQAADAFEHGGYALLRAGRDHGREVIDLAARSPEAARFVAADLELALRLARRYGDEAVRLEGRVPGLVTARPGLLTRTDIGRINRMPESTQRTLAPYLRRADTPETAARIVTQTGERGTSFLRRIPRAYLVGGGMITGALLDRAIREDESLLARSLSASGRAARDTAVDVLVGILAPILVLVGIIGVLIRYAVPWFLRWVTGRSKGRKDSGAGVGKNAGSGSEPP